MPGRAAARTKARWKQRTRRLDHQVVDPRRCVRKARAVLASGQPSLVSSAAPGRGQPLRRVRPVPRWRAAAGPRRSATDQGSPPPGPAGAAGPVRPQCVPQPHRLLGRHRDPLPVDLVERACGVARPAAVQPANDSGQPVPVAPVRGLPVKRDVAEQLHRGPTTSASAESDRSSRYASGTPPSPGSAGARYSRTRSPASGRSRPAARWRRGRVLRGGRDDHAGAQRRGGPVLGRADRRSRVSVARHLRLRHVYAEVVHPVRHPRAPSRGVDHHVGSHPAPGPRRSTRQPSPFRCSSCRSYSRGVRRWAARKSRSTRGCTCSSGVGHRVRARTPVAIGSHPVLSHPRHRAGVEGRGASCSIRSFPRRVSVSLRQQIRGCRRTCACRLCRRLFAAPGRPRQQVALDDHGLGTRRGRRRGLEYTCEALP